METTEQDVFETVWSGSMTGVYLGALQGVPSFEVKQAQAAHRVDARPTGQVIVSLLRARGAMTQTQLASGCNRASGEVRKALLRLVKRGQVMLVEPCLFAMDPQAGALWRLT